MAAFQSVPKFIGFSVGGFCILIVVGALGVAMLIVSLIPIYSPNNSVTGFGEIYTIQGLTIKAIFNNVSLNFTGGNVISISGLSNLCTSILRAQQIPGFQACVATNFTAYGPTGNVNPSTVVRRALNDVALYEIGNIQLVFSNTCANKRAIGYWSYSLLHTQNSSCVAQRLAACRRFITTPNSGSTSNQWLPMPVGYTQLVLTNGTFCVPISISSIYNVAYYNYASVYGFFNLTTSYINAGDCYLNSIVPQSYLQNYIFGQNVYNTSLCTGTWFG